MRNLVVWDKGATTAGDLAGSFGYQYELLVLAAKGRPLLRGARHSDVWRFPRVHNADLLHQNQKPVPLLERAVRSFSDAGDTVMDPFMGSGSTGVACLNLGREFVGCELDPGYFDICKRRLDAEQAQGRLFTGGW